MPVTSEEQVPPTCTGPCAKIQRVLVIVIGGPIASGKSALSRAVAHRFEEMLAVRGAVIDLDLVYEMLDAQRRPKDDPATWVLARRTAGRLTSTLLADGLFVVVEGDVVSDRALREFEAELPGDVLVRIVMLEVAFKIALERATADSGRGISKDPAFLAAHYEQFRADELDVRDPLRIDTTNVTVSQAAEAVVDWAQQQGPPFGLMRQ
jgi:hypothetical protein